MFENVAAPVSANVLDNVVAPVTANVSDNIDAPFKVEPPVTVSPELKVAAPPTFNNPLAVIFLTLTSPPNIVKPELFKVAAPPRKLALPAKTPLPLLEFNSILFVLFPAFTPSLTPSELTSVAPFNKVIEPSAPIAALPEAKPALPSAALNIIG